MHVIFYKKWTIFSLGFALGFVVPFFYQLYQSKKWDLLNSMPGIVASKSQKYFPKSADDNSPRDWPIIRLYNEWLENENAERVKIDQDFYSYAPKKEKEIYGDVTLESNWLKEKVHLTCVIYVTKIKLSEAISSTWGSRCNKLHFFTNRKITEKTALPIVNFETKFSSSWEYLCFIFHHIWNFSKAVQGQMLEWVIFAKDDTIVVTENLRMILATLDFDQAHYLGHPITLWGQAYNVAQAGFVLSKESIRKILELFDSDEKCASGGKYWKMEDYYLGKHLESFGIRPSDMRDYKKRGIFHAYSLNTLLWGIAKPGNFWTKAIYPSESTCCSEFLVTFNVPESGKLYSLNYLLYHLHVHRTFGIYGTKPAAVSDKDLWKVTLKKEFGLENFTDISSEKYYELWREKYSSPEEFIARNFKMTTDASYNQTL